MKHVWGIFIQDLKNIRRVPLIAVLLIALGILPSLYAWFNLSATWDPYANTGGIKIAVVNEDEGVTIEDHNIQVGQELVNNLKQNDQLGWTFVDKQEASEGVQTGKYYAAIYIDANFSKDLTSFLSGTPERAIVHYEVNEKKNAIAPKMTSTGASTIVQQISDQFIETTTSTLFSELNKASIKIEEELPTLRKMKHFVFELENHLPAIQQLGNKMVALDENWNVVEEKFDTFLNIQNHLPEIHDGTNQFQAMMEHLPEIRDLSDTVLEYEPVVARLETFAQEPIDTTTVFTEIDQQMNNSIDEMIKLQTKIDELQQKVITIENKANNADEYLQLAKDILQQADEIVEPLIDLIIDQSATINESATKIDGILAEIENRGLIEETYNSLITLNERIKTPIAVLNSAVEMLASLNEMLPGDRLSATIANFTDLVSRLQSLQTTIQTIIDTIEANQITTEKIVEWREKLAKISTIANDINEFLNNGGKEQIIQFIDTLNKKVDELNSELLQAKQMIAKFDQFLNRAESLVNDVIESTVSLQAQLPQIEDKVATTMTKLQEEIRLITDHYQFLSSFIKEDLPEIETALYKVSQFLEDDFPNIEQQYLQVAEKVETNLPNIKNIVHELANMNREHLPTFETQLQNVANQIRELDNNEKLDELVKFLKNDLTKESEFFADPVQLMEEKLYPIPNYGSANAPFYTTLCLWVGALLLSNLLSTEVHEQDRKPEYNHRHIYLGRLILFLIVGLLQGLVVSIGNFLILGVYAAHPIWFVVFSLLIAFVFMTIVYTLASILGNIGKGLAIILLVLQLSSSGGTFPVEVIPPFFQAIHPYLPFTYGINLLREAVGGIYMSQVWLYIIVLLGFWALFITLGLLLKKVLTNRILETAKKTKLSRLVE